MKRLWHFVRMGHLPQYAKPILEWSRPYCRICGVSR